MSDLHLGAFGIAGRGASVLDVKDGRDPMGPDGPFERFLRDHVGRHDAVILLGDILELALATYDQTAPRAARLVSLLREHCTDAVYFVPGNHDHYAWTLVQDADAVTRKFPHFSSNYFPTHQIGQYSDTFLRTIGIDHVAYPTLAWQPPRSAAGTAAASYLFHHGHFCSETYTLVSSFYRDLFDGQVTHLAQLEGMNAGWLNLVWYHLGQAGIGVGANGLVERIYEELRATGTSPAVERAIERLYRLKLAAPVREALRRYAGETWWLTAGAATWLADRLDKVMPAWLTKAVLAYAEHEEHSGGRGVSVDRWRALDAGLVAHADDLVRLVAASEPRLAAGATTLVFGHTHIQGEAHSDTARYLNTGGWVTTTSGGWPDAFVLSIDAAGVARFIHYDGAAAVEPQRRVG
ncbi:MAG: metallophosphoesterase [Kofleriaceae bacterium]